MVENDFTGEKKFFFAKVTPKRVWFRTKNAENFFCTKYLIETLKVTKYQHHMTVFKKLTVEIVRAWRKIAPQIKTNSYSTEKD